MATQQDVEDLAEDIGIAIKGLIPNKTSDVTNDGDDGTHPFLDTSDIVNDLSTGGTTKVLSAEQGKALYDLIDEGTIAELKELITDAITNNNGILILTRNYKATSTDTQIIINNNLTIIGNGHTIDADNLLSIIAISTSTNVTFDSLTIINSISTGNGGAIYNEGTLQLTNCTLANNTANNGGAIDNRATLTATDTTFINNQITSNTGEGGAIRGVSGATTTLINCTFINNKSAYRGGAMRFKEATITNCRFINNTATNNGGAIFITSSPTANISNTIFKDNTANNGASIYSTDSITTINCTYPTSTTTNVTDKPYITN